MPRQLSSVGRRFHRSPPADSPARQTFSPRYAAFAPQRRRPILATCHPVRLACFRGRAPRHNAVTDVRARGVRQDVRNRASFAPTAKIAPPQLTKNTPKTARILYAERPRPLAQPEPVITRLSCYQGAIRYALPPPQTRQHASHPSAHRARSDALSRPVRRGPPAATSSADTTTNHGPSTTTASPHRISARSTVLANFRSFAVTTPADRRSRSPSRPGRTTAPRER